MQRLGRWSMSRSVGSKHELRCLFGLVHLVCTLKSHEDFVRTTQLLWEQAALLIWQAKGASCSDQRHGQSLGLVTKAGMSQLEFSLLLAVLGAEVWDITDLITGGARGVVANVIKSIFFGFEIGILMMRRLPCTPCKLLMSDVKTIIWTVTLAEASIIMRIGCRLSFRMPPDCCTFISNPMHLLSGEHENFEEVLGGVRVRYQVGPGLSSSCSQHHSLYPRHHNWRFFPKLVLFVAVITPPNWKHSRHATHVYAFSCIQNCWHVCESERPQYGSTNVHPIFIFIFIRILILILIKSRSSCGLYLPSLDQLSFKYFSWKFIRFQSAQPWISTITITIICKQLECRLCQLALGSIQDRSGFVFTELCRFASRVEKRPCCHQRPWQKKNCPRWRKK